MIVTTESGAQYMLTIVPAERPGLIGLNVFKAQKEGQKPAAMIAIRPELLANVEAAETYVKDGEFLCGYNRSGGRTFRVLPTQIKKGYILVTPKGRGRSTRIVEIVR